MSRNIVNPVAPLSMSITKLAKMEKNSKTPKSEIQAQKRIVKKRLFSLAHRGTKWAAVSVLIATALGTVIGYSRTQHAKLLAGKHMLSYLSGYNRKTTLRFVQSALNGISEGKGYEWKHVANIRKEYIEHPWIMSAVLESIKSGFFNN